MSLELAALIDLIRDRVRELTWAIDLADGAAALMIALLLHRDQPVFHLRGIAVNRASAGYRGEGKTDARTPRSSPTKLGCAAICVSYSCLTMTLCGCGC
jgi:hypothetical protein